ncbi:PTS glucose transporter subunit IIA, partial [Priestia megaterium]|uniref:PTS glucose transporter subunit IIA n=1 Tax=Priestia megaterium TaxID=1404 RepID=UPI001649C733
LSPVARELLHLFHTKHPVPLKTQPRTQLLIHIPLQTLPIQPQPFQPHLTQPHKLTLPTPLITFHLALIQQKPKTIIT